MFAAATGHDQSPRPCDDTCHIIHARTQRRHMIRCTHLRCGIEERMDGVLEALCVRLCLAYRACVVRCTMYMCAYIYVYLYNIYICACTARGNGNSCRVPRAACRVPHHAGDWGAHFWNAERCLLPPLVHRTRNRRHRHRHLHLPPTTKRAPPAPPDIFSGQNRSGISSG